MQKTILLGLNELNFEYIEKYIEKGLLPNFQSLFEDYGYKETTSENEYKLLEPWIQWVTVHTGRAYSEHKVFRLGDIVGRKDLVQIWEKAEECGHTVGAVSPFNAENRLESPKFFVPDPWTQTNANGDAFVIEVAEAVSQAVNDNAQGGLKLKSILSILKTYLKVVSLKSYGEYIHLAALIKSKVGIKAVILDKLLGDLFVQQWIKYKPEFSSLFLNTGAHFQHHYMFNSLAYDGSLRNPDWYCPLTQDPLILILEEYDKLIGRLMGLNVRLLISTGLHQKPHNHMTFYWRLKKHEHFLEKINISNYNNVIPRMSRDFLIEFDSEKLAIDAQSILESFVATKDDTTIFTVDNRGKSLFVELTYPNDIEDDFGIIGNVRIDNFKRFVAFVAIKNGEHHGIGYFIDTFKNDLPPRFPLTDVYGHIVASF